jgi:hypothetical protein
MAERCSLLKQEKQAEENMPCSLATLKDLPLCGSRKERRGPPSPDGQWALVLQNMSPPDFVLLPTGVGEQHILSTPNVTPSRGQFLLDSKHIAFDGHEPGHASRIYVMTVNGGPPRAVSPEGFSIRGVRAVSPDGKRIAAVSGKGLSLVSVDGNGEPQAVPVTEPGDVPIGWSADARALLVGHQGEMGCPVSRVDLQNGTRTAWKTFSPSSIAGLVSAN